MIVNTVKASKNKCIISHQHPCLFQGLRKKGPFRKKDPLAEKMRLPAYEIKHIKIQSNTHVLHVDRYIMSLTQ